MHSTIVRTLVYAEGAIKNGRQAAQAAWCRDFITKIHVTVDSLSNPLRLRLTAGQLHDIIKTHNLTVDLAFDYVVADRSSRSKVFRDNLILRGIQRSFGPGRMPKKRRNYDEWHYRE